MSASRSLYRDMAQTIRLYVDGPFSEGQNQIMLRLLTNRLCEDLKNDNMAFSREKFLEACGFSG